MDNLQPFGAEDGAEDAAVDDEAAIEHPPSIGTDERRMHVRAYNHWASLLGDRVYPSIEDLEPQKLEDFGPHSVLLDFSTGADDPIIAWLGRALRDECDLDAGVRRVSEVPGRSLLSRLTDHYMQIIANQAPVGFEAEFVNHHGRNTLYRGILMPFSSDDDTIDFIYGVINWKEVADAATERTLRGEVSRVLSEPKTVVAPVAPVWADGPSATKPDTALAGSDGEAAPETLADWLVVARSCAEEARSAEGRSRGALYAALGRAYQFAAAADADPQGYAELLEDAGIKRQARAPMTPVVKLVFGADYDKSRLTEFAAALDHGRRNDVAADGFEAWLAGQDGGLKAVVAAERAARRPAGHAAGPDARDALRNAPIQGFVTLDGEAEGEEEYVLLVARRMPGGRFGVIGPVPEDKPLADRALRKFASKR